MPLPFSSRFHSVAFIFASFPVEQSITDFVEEINRLHKNRPNIFVRTVPISLIKL